MEALIRHLYVSPGHNYFGHHGHPAGTDPIIEVPELRCRAGRGIEGDRFFDHQPDYEGQITFFSWEDYLEIREAMATPEIKPGVFRRNVIIEGLDLPALEGRRFEVQGVRFEGATKKTRMCYWMDQAVAPGLEEKFKNRGGLRARILSDGRLTPGPARFGLSPAS